MLFDKNTYDCHYKTHSQVIDEFENWLLINYSPHKGLRVITGNSTKMKRIIMEVLDKHEIDYLTPSYNFGLIVVL